MTEQVKVWKKQNVVIVHVGEPVLDSFFNGNFREVKFMNENGKIIKNSLYNGHYDRLKDILIEGNTVLLESDMDTGWIKSISGERWN